jgi:hypothetical protein
MTLLMHNTGLTKQIMKNSLTNFCLKNLGNKQSIIVESQFFKCIYIFSSKDIIDLTSKLTKNPISAVYTPFHSF